MDQFTPEEIAAAKAMANEIDPPPEHWFSKYYTTYNVVNPGSFVRIENLTLPQSWREPEESPAITSQFTKTELEAAQRMADEIDPPQPTMLEYLQQMIDLAHNITGIHPAIFGTDFGIETPGKTP